MRQICGKWLKYVTRSHKMVLKSVFDHIKIFIYSERGGNADYYGASMSAIGAKTKKLWHVKVSMGTSGHFENGQLKAVHHVLGIFPQQPSVETKDMLI